MRLKSLTYPILFALIIFVLIFIKVLPLNTVPKGWTAPDLSLCVTLVWCLRRPTEAPIILLAALFLLQDIIFQRPIGLFAAVATVMCEWAKHQALRADEFPFFVEWVTAAIAIIAIFILVQSIASLSLIAKPSIWVYVTEFIFTILVYPLVTLLCRYGLGLRTHQVTEFEASLGQDN